MKIEVKKIDKLKRAARIDISGEEFLNKKKEIYQEIAKKLKTPGFRPGKVPVDVLERYHGKVLRAEFLEKTLPYYYQKALEENNLKPAGSPRIYDVEIDEKKLSFSAEFEIQPDIEIKEDDYKGIKVKTKTVVVEEIEIEKVITNLKEEVKKIIKKDLNDEGLAKWAGYPHLENFREAIRGKVYLEKLSTRRQKIENQVVVHLLGRIKIEVPDSEAKRCHKELVDREVYALQLRGVPQADIEKYKKDIDEKFKPIANEQVKISYILKAIADAELIEAGDNLGEVILGFILSQAQYEE